MTLPIGALTPQVVTAVALTSNGTLLVAAAGVVVVLAILLVFVMVLRSNGAAKRTASGLGYDPQQGPLGQPSAGRGGPRQAQGGRAPQRDDFGGGYDDGYDSGYDNNYGGRPSQARGGASQGAQQDPWGAQATPSQARWNDPAAQQRMPSPVGQAPQWGAPDAGMGGAMGAQGQSNGASAWGAQDDNPWGAPADPWSGRASGPSRPGGNPFTAGAAGNMGQMGQMSGPGGQAAPWDAAPQSQGRNPWGAQGSGWDQPDAMSAQAQPGRQDWGAPASQPPARNGRDPFAASPDHWGEPMAPAPGPQGWNQPAPPASPSQPGYRQGGPNSGIGYGEPDKTRVVRPAAAATRVGALIERQGKDPGHVFELRNERTTIGRSRDSDIFLEDLAVSRLHATINRDPAGRYIFRDENSANGVFVNGEKVNERTLEEGDEVQIGQTMLVFQRR